MTAIILAGGKSRRMGTNKALINFRGKTFLEHQIELLKGLFNEVIISANSPETYKDFNVPIVVDTYHDKGPLGGIYTGLLNSNSYHTFILACDMPFVEINLINKLKSFTKDSDKNVYDVVIPENKGQLEPLHAFYSKACISPIKIQIESGNLKISDFFSLVKVRKVKFNIPAAIRIYKNNPLTNVNTRDELNALKDYS